MTVQNWQRAHSFFLKYPQARSSLLWWKEIVKNSERENFADVKQTFGHLADIYEDDWWVFDNVLTHSEYDENIWKRDKKRRDRLKKDKRAKSQKDLLKEQGKEEGNDGSKNG